MSHIDIGNLWGDSPVDPAHQAAAKDMDPVHLQIHLGQHSQFIGLMDTIDKVREHLAAMEQYDTVRANLLGEPVDEAQPTLFGTQLLQQVPEPELSEAELQAIKREALALKLEQRGGRIPHKEDLGKIVDTTWHDKVEEARQDWRRLVARREQLEEEIKEAREHLAWMRANPPA